MEIIIIVNNDDFVKESFGYPPFGSDMGNGLWHSARMRLKTPPTAASSLPLNPGSPSGYMPTKP